MFNNYYEVVYDVEMRQKAVQQEMRVIRLVQPATARQQRVALNCYNLSQRIAAFINSWQRSFIRSDRPVTSATDTTVPCP
jgi:hypothetical protein